MAFGSLRHSSQDDEHPDLAEINIIPLVDIMLVLLIIFMVAAPLSISGIGVQLPSSRAPGGRMDESRVVVSITKDGSFYFDKSLIKAEDLESKLGAIFKVKEKKELYIRADRLVSHGKVIDAMSAAKLAGVSKISMLTTPPQKPSR